MGVVDVVALGNMCVDVLLPPAPIPAPEVLKTEAQLAAFTAASPPQRLWEVGGNCNFLIAAARVGLNAECVGHVGADVYGDFLRDVLADEGVPLRPLHAAAPGGAFSKEGEGTKVGTPGTLACFVLTDGAGGHAFCSRYDLGPWPLLADLGREAERAAATALSKGKAVFVNGFVYDELSFSGINAAVGAAKASGASVFFDPGPRAFTFVRDPERREALAGILSAADVVLATLEEAAALVDEGEKAGGIADAGHAALGGTAVGSRFSEAGVEPAEVARALFDRPGCNARWIVIKCGPDGATLCTRDGTEVRMGSPTVEVGDTVGCGDSAAAAIVLGYLNVAKAEAAHLAAEGGWGGGLPEDELRLLLEETLALATAVGAATATGLGAGRNVASAAKVRELLDRCVIGGGVSDECGFGVSMDAAARAREMLDASLVDKETRESSESRTV